MDFISNQQISRAQKLLSDFSNKSTYQVFERYEELFPELVTKYHDGYRFQSSENEHIEAFKMFYPKWWLQDVGFWGTTNNNPNQITPTQTYRLFGFEIAFISLSAILLAVGLSAVGFIVGQRFPNKKSSYNSINSYV